MCEQKTQIRMEPVHMGTDLGDKTFDNVWISMDLAVGDMGRYA